MNQVTCFAHITHQDIRTLVTVLPLGILLILSPKSFAEPGFVPQVRPPMPKTVVLAALESLQVPEILKNLARKEITDMQSNGYVEAPEETVIYLDRVIDTASLQPLRTIKPTLRINPANLQMTPFAQMTAMGAIPAGTYTPEGWTAVQRVFAAPELGLIGLEEIDYVAAGGGLLMIKEAVNEDINGFPGIRRVKKSNSNKSITELTWATNRKIYTLSMNRYLANNTSSNEFMALANSIKD